MQKDDLIIGMVGSGGDGVVATGEILANMAAEEGLHAMMVKSFGPQIRGGESSCWVRLSAKKIYSQGNALNVLVCFNWNDYRQFEGELDVEEDVIVLVDSKDETHEKDYPIDGGRKRTVIKVPFAELADTTGNPKGKNMVMLGVLAGLFDLPAGPVEHAIRKRFKGKKVEIAEANVRSLMLGIEHVKNNIKSVPFTFKYSKGTKQMLLAGNEAVAFGALAAGCRFYSSYPITPASEIMEWLADELPKVGGTVVQAEDEIAAICMVTGAGYAGVKSMTATSGPGLSLKSEAIGLGTMAEIPYVVVDVQRGGPSTGLPTKSEQGDLHQAVYGMHGTAPHAVIAASDVEDCFRTAIEAFNIAEAYQMPVVLLSDQFIGHRTETVEALDFENVKLKSRLSPEDLKDDNYRRFVDNHDGISPMTWPGIKGGEYLCSGIEHDEHGSPSAKYSVHEKMCAKRERKLEKLEKEYTFVRRYGDKNAKVGVIAWGSNKGVLREAVEYFTSHGKPVSGLVPQLLYPLQKDILKDFFAQLDVLVVVETSFDGQFLHYLRSWVDLPKNVLHLKAAGGRLFGPGEVITEIEKGFRSIS